MSRHGYHGICNSDDIEHVMKSAQVGEYILTNYTANDLQRHAITITLKCHINGNDTLVQWEEYFIQLPRLPCVNCKATHVYPTNYGHPWPCFYTYAKLRPKLKRNPFSLQEFSRSVVCENYTYEQITRLKANNFIPLQLYYFLIDESSMISPFSKYTLICNQLGYCIQVRQFYDSKITMVIRKQNCCLPK